MSNNQQVQDFPLKEAREIAKDLFRPKPAIYWADFLFHISLGWGAFVLCLMAPTFSFYQLIFYLIATLALFRSAIFIHELAHLKKGTFKVFRIVWNVLCGFPLMIPSFVYHGVHNIHHKQNVYGTKDDGEYVPFVLGKWYGIVLYVLFSSAIPIIFFFRFVVLTPLSYLNKKLRNLVWELLSSLAIDLNFKRPLPSDEEVGSWKLQEGLACFYGITIIAMIIMGIVPLSVLILWYCVEVLIFTINSFRTLAAHCYRNPDDREMGLTEQYLDSVNVPGNIFVTSLWAPVGLRYHATHHLFPQMPYHALGETHRRLMTTLSDNTLYKKTLRTSLWDALKRLWQETNR